MNRKQILIRTDKGDTDLFYWMERIEKRLDNLESWAAKQVLEEWEDDTSNQTVIGEKDE